MKVKHIITTCGILLGGLAVAQNAGAVVTYETSSDVQFTFNSVLSLSLSGGDFVIAKLVPNTSQDSNVVTATVDTNSVAGYELSATVGNDTTYNFTDLRTSNSDAIAMISDDGSLSSGTWGYKVDGASTYGKLDRTNSRVLKKTLVPGGGNTTVQIGAYAAANQASGEYKNVMNFAAVANIATHTVTLAAGSNVASVVLGASGTTGSYFEGDSVAIAAICDSGYVFNNWNRSVSYGQLASATTASTTYTVGGGDVTITAYCVAE